MIPKKLHYVRFGNNKKPDTFQHFFDSWKKYCPDYEIVERNESNYDINANPYVKKHYDKQQYAFASDYARIDIIYKEGGIYLDSDIEVVKNLDPLLKNKGFTGFQDVFYVWGSFFGAEKGNPILKELLDFYQTRKRKIIITHSFEKVFKRHGLQMNSKVIQHLDHFSVYPQESFYPFAFYQELKDANITENTYAIHHFNASRLPSYLLTLTKRFFVLSEKVLMLWRIIHPQKSS